MTFGAVIAVKSGPFYLPLDPDIEGALAEVRVEQHLDEPTAFALRFQEDFEGDQPKLTEHPLFKTSTELVILVADGPDAKGLVCLVRGIVEQISFDVDTAGAGSAVDVRGRDVRMMIDRVSEARSFSGKTSDAVIEELITDIPDLQTDIAPGTERYDAATGGPAALNCCGTALEIIETLAMEENHSVWLSYEVSALGPAVSVKTTLNVKPSPDRGGLPGADLPLPDIFKPRPDIQILVNSKLRPNITTFTIQSDNERIKEVQAGAIDESAGGNSPVKATSPNDKLNSDGAGVEDTGGEPGPLGLPSEKPKRFSFLPTFGSPAMVAKKAEAMATEASWYIEAEVMTSMSLYGALLQPHEKVKVVGAGCEWAGDYQVRDCIHVVNGAEHYMTATLRGNSRGKKGP